MATPGALGLSSDVWVKRVNRVATLALFGAALGGAAAGGRAYRRWTKEVNLLTEPRARVERFRTEYQSKRANVMEWGGIIGTIAVEIVAVSGQAARHAVTEGARRAER
jgi:hypothetical protein